MRLPSILVTALACIDNVWANSLLPHYTGYIEASSGHSTLLSILASQGDRADHILYSTKYAFHINEGSPCLGGLIAKSLWHVYSHSRQYISTSPIPPTLELQQARLPKFRIEINLGQFSYADLLDLIQAMRILTMEMNNGQLPTYGGIGTRWHGSIYKNGSRVLADGRFYFV